MNWGIPARWKIKLRAKITVITLVLFSFVLSACPPLEEDPVDGTLVFKGPLDLNKWMDILHSIETRGLPVIVDLSECTIPATGGDVLKRVLADGSDPEGYSETTYIQFNPLSGYWYGKELITSIILPKAATMISHATSDTDIKVIPDDDKWRSAFRHFKRLRSVTGENIALIGNLAFIGCEALEEVKCDRTVIVSQFAFYGCTSLKDLHFEVAREVLTSAFENCTSLEKANFPYVGTVSQNAFKNCVSLVDIDFDSATKIDEDAFRNCSSLKRARFRAKPERTNTGHPLQRVGGKYIVDQDSVIFYENAMRGCSSLELLDIRYAWNVFFDKDALSDIGENLDLYLFDDGGENNDGKTYGHPQAGIREYFFLGQLQPVDKERGNRTVKAITISAPVVTPPENSQIMRVDSADVSMGGIRNFIDLVYNGQDPDRNIKITVKRE